MASAIASKVSAVGAVARRELAPSVASKASVASLVAARKACLGTSQSLSSVSWVASRVGLKKPAARFVSSSSSSSSRSGAGQVVATISVGDKLPEAQLSYFDKDGNVQSVSVSELTKGVGEERRRWRQRVDAV